MKNFFRSWYFAGMLALILVTLVIMIFSAVSGGEVSIIQNAVGVIITPIQKGLSAVGDFFGDRIAFFTDIGEMRDENERLREEVSELERQLAGYEEALRQNETLKGYLGLKDLHPEFEIASAEVISRDPSNAYEVFTIDKGTSAGISPQCPVITAGGLVGVVIEAGYTWAKVATIVDQQSPVGAIVRRTRDVGVVEGDPSLKEDGLCRMSYLPSHNSAETGDIIETSGLGDVFPKGLVIGTVTDVLLEGHGITYYAVIEPAVDFREIKEVMVITSYTVTGEDSGEGDMTPDGGESGE